MASETPGIAPGDLLRIERRYVLDGQLTCVTDHGRFERVERVGSSEHLVVVDAKRKEVRMFPLHAIAEIAIVKPARRGKRAGPAPQASEDSSTGAPWDPGFA
jgi:hypothetical protein